MIEVPAGCKIKERHYTNGDVLSREYFLNNKRYCYAHFYEKGTLEYYIYYQNNSPHRLDGPACERFYSDGTLKYCIWYKNASYHRLNGPAWEIFLNNGTPAMRLWYQNNSLHRNNHEGPAYESFYSNGNIYLRKWYQNGLRHRLDGPAYEQFCESGKCATIEYWLNDKGFTETEHKRQAAILRLAAQTANTKGVSL